MNSPDTVSSWHKFTYGLGNLSVIFAEFLHDMMSARVYKLSTYSSIHQMVSHGAVIIHQGCQINKITASCSKLQLNIKLQQKIRPCWEECFPALDSVLMHASVTLLLMHIYRQKLWYLPWKTKLLNIQQTSSVAGGNNNMRRWWYTSYKYRIVSIL